jgi:hypothetical protein
MSYFVLHFIRLREKKSGNWSRDWHGNYLKSSIFLNLAPQRPLSFMLLDYKTALK